jgi:hypothetical protein
MPVDRRLLGLTLVLAPAVAAQTAAVVEQGRFFDVHAHFARKPLADQALAAAEATWAAAVKQLGASKSKPSNRFAIHLYRTPADYEAVDQELNQGAFKDAWSFAHLDTKSAHIVVQPITADSVLDRVGLPPLTRRLVVYEAAKFAVQASLDNFRAHPAWFAEGLAAWVLDGAMVEAKLRESAAADPFDATRFVWVQKLAAGGKLPKVERLLSDPTLEGVEAWYHWPLQRTLFSFLVERHPREMQALIKAAKALPGSDSFTAKLNAEVKKRLGKAWSDVDARYAAWVKELKPAWEEPFRSLDAVREPWLQIAFEDTDALAWRTEPVGTKTYAWTGTVELLPATSSQANIVLDRQDNGYLFIGLQAGKEAFASRYDAKAPEASQWSSLGQAKAKGLEVGKPTQLEVDVTPARIAVAIGGETVLEFAPGERPLDGPWGIGVLRGSAAYWRGVRVEK